jgi:UDP-glucose 6-dehydrogenase
MNVLLIGYGHIAHWLKKHISRYHDVQWLDVKPKKIRPPTHVLEICFPYSKHFERQVFNYTVQFKPKLLIVESTVQVGTTNRIWKALSHFNALNDWILGPIACAHSPLRGTSFNWWRFVKMIGPVNEESGRVIAKYYERMGLKTKVLRSPLETELGKILDTSIYGLNIAWTQEMWRICRKLGVDFKEAYEEFSRTFTIDPNYEIQRPIFYPGFIGKECVIPNARLLNKLYPSKFLEAMLESNRKRGKELKLLNRTQTRK